MKIDRLIAIIMMLLNKKKITAKELAEYFEVSVRTIQRDMDNLCMAGVPIYADVGKNGGYQLVEDYKLDRNFLNVDEAKMLLSFLKNLESSVPYAEAKSINDKLTTLLPGGSVDEKFVFRMNPMVRGGQYRDCMGNLAKARDEQKKVKITYIDANLRESVRVIAPYRLVMMGTVWYVYGYCDERDDFRIFKVARIIECVLLDEVFEVKEMPEVLPWNNFLSGNRPATNLILEIDTSMKGQIPDYFDYKSCKVLEDKIVVTVAFPVDEWLFSLLMSMVPRIKVVEPGWVQEEMVRRMVRGIEKMS